MIKKISILFALCVFPLFLFGCERKSTQITTEQIPAVEQSSESSESESQNEGESEEVTQSPTSSQESQSEASTQNEDTSSLGETYLKNLNTATAKVQKALKNTASFCSATVEVASGQTLSQASQSFFYTTTNEGLKDWYWVVTVDSIEKKELHSLIAKSAFKDDFECASLAPDQAKLSFSGAYNRAEEVGALLTSIDIVKTKIIYSGRSWKIVQFDEQGKKSILYIDAENGYVSQDKSLLQNSASSDDE
ncbi:MAG: hypothetical protein BWY43_00371 [candidate division WS2 bacterium ADurb.Bin280]|uniref:PepSY domain-containing protein n=1 Tax=candidate division WS2 bacterium ADurb.Bin280 TaxID=1852829 RepID=A0A1V5SEN8_9BACT|nr:MAG: hypothetical protein BWY43_00371 [candidate division WS2 bacterium ADurb.Bin280]